MTKNSWSGRAGKQRGLPGLETERGKENHLHQMALVGETGIHTARLHRLRPLSPVKTLSTTAGPCINFRGAQGQRRSERKPHQGTTGVPERGGFEAFWEIKVRTARHNRLTLDGIPGPYTSDQAPVCNVLDREVERIRRMLVRKKEEIWRNFLDTRAGVDEYPVANTSHPPKPANTTSDKETKERVEERP